MPPIAERAREIYRILRRQPVGVQTVAVVAALSLVAGVTLVGTRGGSSTGPSEVAIGPGPRSIPGGPYPGPGGVSPTGPVTGPDGTVGVPGPGGPDGVGGVPGGPGGGSPGGGGGPGGQPPVNLRLTDSDRGVKAASIKIAFPWYSAASSDEITGTTAAIEDQEDAIRAFVGDINANGGILGRRIEPVIERFDPINFVDMTAKCEKWSNDDKVFAVVDGVGAWHGPNQTCLANLKTPLLSGWTTVKSLAQASAPYIWWTAASAEDTIDHMIIWANRKGLITTANDHESAMIFSDRAGDREALKRMRDALGRFNLRVRSEIVPFNNASANAALPGIIQRLRDLGIKRVIMMLPFTTFSFWLNHADAQEFTPRHLLSDYESTMVVAEALLGAQHPVALHRAIGPVSLNLGVTDDSSHYTAEERRCNVIWRRAYPDADHKNLERGGVGFRWCQGITVFAEATRRATLAAEGALTRLNWATHGVSRLRNIPSPMTPSLSWAPGDYAGTEWMKIVEVRTSGCPASLDTDDNGACHIEVEPFGRILRVS